MGPGEGPREGEGRTGEGPAEPGRDQRHPRGSRLTEPPSPARYKPPATETNPALEDPTPDYMNLLGMVFSMCGLMLKVRLGRHRELPGGTGTGIGSEGNSGEGRHRESLWRGSGPFPGDLRALRRSPAHAGGLQGILGVAGPIPAGPPGVSGVSRGCPGGPQLKWCAWIAVYCSFISFANSRSSEDTKQMMSSFM